MLALAVTAGEGPMGAIDRVTRLASGPLVTQLEQILAEIRFGTSFLTALTAARDRTRLEPLARFVDGMAVAIERGTPLADVLRAPVADVRALGKRQLLESGGRREIAMMIPVHLHPQSPEPITARHRPTPADLVLSTRQRNALARQLRKVDRSCWMSLFSATTRSHHPLENGIISRHTMSDAVTVGDYFIDHALSSFDAMRMPTRRSPARQRTAQGPPRVLPPVRWRTVGESRSLNETRSQPSASRNRRRDHRLDDRP